MSGRCEMPESMSAILLSPRDRLVTVFGGGKVALRKCRHFSGFRIRVVSEEVMPELRELAEEVVVDTITEKNILRYIEDADIVVAATSDRVLNDRIRDTSMSVGKMTNSAHGGGDVLIPSCLHRRGWSVFVSSEGKVPAFPPYVVGKIDGFLDSTYDEMLELLAELRVGLSDKIGDQPSRAKFLADVLADEDVWRLLAEGKMEEAKRLAAEKGGIL